MKNKNKRKRIPRGCLSQVVSIKTGCLISGGPMAPQASDAAERRRVEKSGAVSNFIYLEKNITNIKIADIVKSLE